MGMNLRRETPIAINGSQCELENLDETITRTDRCHRLQAELKIELTRTTTDESGGRMRFGWGSVRTDGQR